GTEREEPRCRADGSAKAGGTGGRSPMGCRKGLLFVVLMLGGSCGSREPASVEPVYDKLTGKLRLLKYDANGDGKVDTWSYMDGTRVVRIEIDMDEDGKIDRWEYYDADQKLEKTGTSRANDGKEDAWVY